MTAQLVAVPVAVTCGGANCWPTNFEGGFANGVSGAAAYGFYDEQWKW